MNNVRRKQLQTIIDMIETIKSSLEEVREAEDDAFNNLPESIQYSERGEKMETATYNMDDAIGDLETAIDYLNEAME